MSEMIERVARAILDYSPHVSHFTAREMMESFYADQITGETTETTKAFISELGFEIARAAIEAMREHDA
jgi:hypothetical protein